jgi:hypothetical protein
VSKTYDRCYTLEDSFVYFLDCQLATVQDLEMLKNPPKGRLRRHRGIARKMIEKARAHGIDLSGESRVVAFEEKEQA